jgi:putative endonuclease
MNRSCAHKKRLGHYKAGLWAENAAACYLRAKGYRICARRFKTPVGEIDIVAQKKDVLAFIEVKRRATHGEGAEAVTKAAQDRITRAAGLYLARHPDKASCAIRFDVVTVTAFLRLRHLDNAWRPRA